MADAKDKGQATGPDDVKKATAAAKDATARADDKAKEAAQAKSPGAKVTAPSTAPAGKSDKGAAKVDEAEQANSATAETRENREANEAPLEMQAEGPQPEFVMDERKNRREGPEKVEENKAFPDAPGAHQAPLEKTAGERRDEEKKANVGGRGKVTAAPRYRDEHAALQEDQQWVINREQARVTTSETPAGDSRPAPEGNESANWVDTPARAHTLSEEDDYGTADSVGKRLRRATESAKLEERDGVRGLHSDALPGAYSVEEELRMQWPDINLGDENVEE